MKEIKLVNNKGIALIDDIDFNLISQCKWYLSSNGYAFAHYKIDGKWGNIKMHRLILGLTDPKIETDHKDHNKLDNRRFNLRPCTHAENLRNGVSRGKIKYLGVHYICTKYGIEKYRSRITIEGKRILLGDFKTPEEAAISYDNAAKIHYKEFANINFK